MDPSPSCSVNIDPDGIVYHNFDPDSDFSLTLKVLQDAKGKLDDDLSSNKPQTDKYLELCAKKRRKEKRIEKALRRKAARKDRL